MLKYCLVENLMTNKTAKFIAHVSSLEDKNLDDVIDFMLAEGSGLTRPLALAYFEKLTQTILHFMDEGHSVTTPLFRVRPTITGPFDSKEDKFDANRHEIKVRMTAGLRLRKSSYNTHLEKVEVTPQLPYVSSFYDASSEQKDTSATVGSIGIIVGKQLQFDPSDPSQGVFFVSVDHPQTAIRAKVYSKILPAEIHFNIPMLESGTYKIKVSAASRNEKSINSGVLKSIITI